MSGYRDYIGPATVTVSTPEGTIEFTEKVRIRFTPTDEERQQMELIRSRNPGFYEAVLEPTTVHIDAASQKFIIIPRAIQCANPP